MHRLYSFSKSVVSVQIAQVCSVHTSLSRLVFLDHNGFCLRRFAFVEHRIQTLMKLNLALRCIRNKRPCKLFNNGRLFSCSLSLLRSVSRFTLSKYPMSNSWCLGRQSNFLSLAILVRQSSLQVAWHIAAETLHSVLNSCCFRNEFKLLGLEIDSSVMRANDWLLGHNLSKLHWQLRTMDGVSDVSGDRSAVILNGLLDLCNLLGLLISEGLWYIHGALGASKHFLHSLVFDLDWSILPTCHGSWKKVLLLICPSSDLKREGSKFRPLAIAVFVQNNVFIFTVLRILTSLSNLVLFTFTDQGSSSDLVRLTHDRGSALIAIGRGPHHGVVLFVCLHLVQSTCGVSHWVFTFTIYRRD